MFRFAFGRFILYRVEKFHLGAVLFSRLLLLQQRRAVPFCRISLFRMKMTEGTMAAWRKRIQMKTVSWMLPSDTSGTSQ